MASLEVSKEAEKCDFCEEIQRASDACPPNPNKPKLTKAGTVILGISGALFVGVYAATAPFLLPALRKVCLPFVPATAQQVKNVFSALSGRGGSLMDIGSGDGRIVSEMIAKIIFPTLTITQTPGFGLQTHSQMSLQLNAANFKAKCLNEKLHKNLIMD
jgi:hypothetical protein